MRSFTYWKNGLFLDDFLLKRNERYNLEGFKIFNYLSQNSMFKLKFWRCGCLKLIWNVKEHLSRLSYRHGFALLYLFPFIWVINLWFLEYAALCSVCISMQYTTVNFGRFYWTYKKRKENHFWAINIRLCYRIIHTCLLG